MSIVLKNNASDFLASSIDSSQTTLTLQSAASFPTIGGAQYFYATLQDTVGQVEIVKVTARSGNNFTVIRGQDGTSAVSFAAGSRVELRVNVGSIEGGAYTPLGVGASTRTIQNKLRDVVSVKDFGAVGDGVADDTLAIQTAINQSFTNDAINFVVFFPEGTYRLTSTLNMRRAQIDASQATFAGDHTGIILLMGGRAQNGNNPVQYVNTVTRLQGSDSSVTPAIRIIGAKGQHIEIQFAGYIQLYADSDNSNLDGSIAYSTFVNKFCNVLELTTNPNPIGSNIQWINENQFFLNRCSSVLINGTYTHNFNRFFGGTFENVGEINIQSGASNTFYDLRGEGGACSVTFASGTYNNIVEFNYWSAPPSIFGFEAGVFPSTRSVTDNGIGNFVIPRRAGKYEDVVVYSLGLNNKCFTATASNMASDIQGLSIARKGITSFTHPNTFQILHDVMIPVRRNSIVVFQAAEAYYRPLFSAYDANMALLGATGLQQAGGQTVVTASLPYTPVDGISISTNTTNTYVAVVSDDVKFVRVFTRTGNGGSPTITSINVFARHPVGALPLAPFSSKLDNIPVVTASPTVGFALRGQKVSDRAGGWYTATFALDTTTTASALTGATTIDVGSVSGVTAADIVGIEYAQNEAQWTSVVSVVGNTVTLTDALTNDVPSGARVVFNRWTNS